MNIEHGKLSPQNIDIEEAVLGALMIDTKAINNVFDIIKAEMFYKDSHKKIYQSISDLFSNSKQIDILTITNNLKLKGYLEEVGGPYGVALLSEKVATALHIVEHSLEIQRYYLLREVIKECHKASDKAYTNDDSVIEDLTNGIEKIQMSIDGSKKKESYVESVVKQKNEFLENNGKGIQGLITGISNYDNKMRGFDKTDLIIFAGRPGMGKTSFALHIANTIRHAITKQKGTSLFFSLEMSKAQLIKRKVKAQLEYEVSERYTLNNATDKDLESIISAYQNIGEDTIIIDDSPYMTADKIRAKAKLTMMREDIDMIIIDYLQLMTDKGKDKNEITGNITRKLKLLAKELNVPIILISQLNRSVETRGGLKKPILSDLRDSGAIEQDADIVNFFYRPEYYDINECFIDGKEGCDTKGCFIVDFAKYREGATGNVYLRSNQNITNFSDWDSGDKPTVIDPLF